MVNSQPGQQPLLQSKVLKLRQLLAPIQAQEWARLKVMQGADIGFVFVVMQPSITIGREQDNDLLLLDLKASRHHAKLYLKEKLWVLEDNGSQNGIFYKNKTHKKITLKVNDTFTLGSTTFEFQDSRLLDEALLLAPPNTVEQLEKQQSYLLQQQKRILKQTQTPPPQTQSNQQMFRMILFSAVIIVSAYFFFDNSEIAVRGGKKNKNNTLTLAELNQRRSIDSDMKSTRSAANALFKDGLREFLDGNFMRAQTQFETVLQVDPDHELAKTFLDNCHVRIESEVKKRFELGKRALDAGKLRDAKSHYLRVKGLLFRDQSNPAYKEANDALDRIADLLGTKR